MACFPWAPFLPMRKVSGRVRSQQLRASFGAKMRVVLLGLLWDPPWPFCLALKGQSAIFMQVYMGLCVLVAFSYFSCDWSTCSWGYKHRAHELVPQLVAFNLMHLLSWMTWSGKWASNFEVYHKSKLKTSWLAFWFWFAWQRHVNIQHREARPCEVAQRLRWACFWTVSCPW